MKVVVYRHLIEELRAPLSQLLDDMFLTYDDKTKTVTVCVDDVSDYELFAYAVLMFLHDQFGTDDLEVNIKLIDDSGDCTIQAQLV